MKAQDVALYLIGACSVDNLKLQKLLYYSQAVHLYLNDTILFEEEIQAWMYGPVIKEIYHTYKDFDFQKIKDDTESTIRYTKEQLKTMDLVAAYYGSFTGPELINETHSEKPWIDAYDGNNNSVISIDSMKEFYINHYVMKTR